MKRSTNGYIYASNDYILLRYNYNRTVFVHTVLLVRLWKYIIECEIQYMTLYSIRDWLGCMCCGCEISTVSAMYRLYRWLGCVRTVR